MQAVNVARLHIHVLFGLLGAQRYGDMELLGVTERSLLPRRGIHLGMYLSGKSLLVVHKIAFGLVKSGTIRIDG